jgi:hypothetical protein
LFITEGIKKYFDDIFPVEIFTGNLRYRLVITLLMNQDIQLKVKERYASSQRHKGRI